MLILGHVGGAVALSTLAEKRFHIRPNYCLVIPIALGPDIFFFQELRKGKFLGHTLLFGLVLCGLLYLLRREWLIYGLVWLLHLPCDALWLAPETFLWPLLGWRFTDWEARLCSYPVCWECYPITI